MSTTISKYEVQGNEIVIDTPYCNDVVQQCRRWAGKFNGGWHVPKSRLEAVQELLGHNFADLVEVEVGEDDWEGRQQIHVGWYVLAGRRGRDSRADIYADLVDGEVPSRGGSAKSPAVDPSRDARFRLWVPRDFAEARELQIVTDPKAGKDHDPKAEAIKQIKALMAEHGIMTDDLN